VVIVSERTAARLWPGAEPVGKRVLTNAVEGKELEWQTVVGVVEDARYREIDTPRYDFYVPFRQAESEVQHFVVRTSGEPLALVPTLKERFRGIDPELTLEGATSMEQIVERTVAPWWFSTFVFVMLSAMALAFAAVGLFAVIAYTMRQRTREIGVRIALGARASDVVNLLLKEGATLCMAGLAIGVPTAWALTGFLSSLLVSVTPTDPGTFAAAILTLAAVCLGATYLPARRAAAVDPVTALKAE
jgi:putative ABC transport system permease protein